MNSPQYNYFYIIPEALEERLPTDLKMQRKETDHQFFFSSFF